MRVGVGRSALDISPFLAMNEKLQKRFHDDREFDAAMLRSRNDTQGEAGVGLKPLSVTKLRNLLLVRNNRAPMMNPQGKSSTMLTDMLCTQSSGKKMIVILADPKTRIGIILRFVGLPAACKAPFPRVLYSVSDQLLPRGGM